MSKSELLGIEIDPERVTTCAGNYDLLANSGNVTIVIEIGDPAIDLQMEGHYKFSADDGLALLVNVATSTWGNKAAACIWPSSSKPGIYGVECGSIDKMSLDELDDDDDEPKCTGKIVDLSKEALVLPQKVTTSISPRGRRLLTLIGITKPLDTSKVVAIAEALDRYERTCLYLWVEGGTRIIVFGRHERGDAKRVRNFIRFRNPWDVSEGNNEDFGTRGWLYRNQYALASEWMPSLDRAETTLRGLLRGIWDLG